ncbi:unnamed protein product [Fraxinus pennsylvanica]|uniref:GPI inositol-deacylase PGAP1-like alpha/beta domain-containing protein n=1 Tax=Fraxinus pennsylvanica TaxID=56036 RepID=A0AAD2A3K3_9LAMI|nr:unnamed protein product [Fraxinus pennsylvanica]
MEALPATTGDCPHTVASPHQQTCHPSNIVYIYTMKDGERLVSMFTLRSLMTFMFFISLVMVEATNSQYTSLLDWFDVDLEGEHSAMDGRILQEHTEYVVYAIHRFLIPNFTFQFLWRFFPHLKEIFATPGLSQHYVHQMALCVKDHTNVLPADISSDFPGYACLLGNLLEAAGVAFTQPGSFDRHIPRINGDILSVDEATFAHQRLLDRYS